MIIDKWDADEKARDGRTYDTKENSIEALNHILKQYLLLKNRKIDPRKPLRDAIDLIQNTCIMIKTFINLHYKIIGFIFIMMKKIIGFILQNK